MQRRRPPLHLGEMHLVWEDPVDDAGEEIPRVHIHVPIRFDRRVLENIPVCNKFRVWVPLHVREDHSPHLDVPLAKLLEDDYVSLATLVVVGTLIIDGHLATKVVHAKKHVSPSRLARVLHALLFPAPGRRDITAAALDWLKTTSANPGLYSSSNV
jgi:hypothetical protein